MLLSKSRVLDSGVPSARAMSVADIGVREASNSSKISKLRLIDRIEDSVTSSCNTQTAKSEDEGLYLDPGGRAIPRASVVCAQALSPEPPTICPFRR